MRKGFTLVELLAAIVIVMVLGVLIVPKTLQIINESKTKSYKEVEKRLVEAASKYIIEHPFTAEDGVVTITKEELIEAHYISEIYDFTDGSVCSAYVEIIDLDTAGTYIPHLSCHSYSDN